MGKKWAKYSPSPMFFSYGEGFFNLSVVLGVGRAKACPIKNEPLNFVLNRQLDSIGYFCFF